VDRYQCVRRLSSRLLITRSEYYSCCCCIYAHMYCWLWECRKNKLKKSHITSEGYFIIRISSFQSKKNQIWGQSRVYSFKMYYSGTPPLSEGVLDGDERSKQIENVHVVKSPLFYWLLLLSLLLLLYSIPQMPQTGLEKWCEEVMEVKFFVFGAEPL